MKPPPFRYLRPTSIEAAVDALAEHGDEAKLLAGGQSLLPMMNFRLARPAVLVDLERVPGLDDLDADDDVLKIGAMARQSRVSRSADVAARLPLLAAALRHVGHHQIRTRGTIGGSLAHADPAAELPAVALLTDADLQVRGPGGTRAIPAKRFFQGPFSTDLRDDEIVMSVRFPVAQIESWAFEELTRRRGDFAIAGVAAARFAGKVRLVGFGLGWVPLRLGAAEAAVSAGGLTEAGIDAAADAARDEVDPMADIHADADYRSDAIATLVARTLRTMAA
jgi:carbon-monoxide dehydrogenase medium subunit